MSSKSFFEKTNPTVFISLLNSALKFQQYNKIYWKLKNAENVFNFHQLSHVLGYLERIEPWIILAPTVKGIDKKKATELHRYWAEENLYLILQFNST